MRLPELKAQLAQLNAEVEAARVAELDEAISACKQIIEMYGLTTFDLFGKVQEIAPNRGSRTFRAKAPRSVAPPKYRDPETGATWSGRGRAPHWMNGHDRDDFLIG